MNSSFNKYFQSVGGIILLIAFVFQFIFGTPILYGFNALSTKEYSIGSNNIELYYIQNHFTYNLLRLERSVYELNSLSYIVAGDNLEGISYSINGTSLEDFQFRQNIIDKKINGFSFSFFLEKYASEYLELAKQSNLTYDDCNSIVSAIVYGVFGDFSSIPENVESIKLIISELSSDYFLLQGSSQREVIISSDFINITSNAIALDIGKRMERLYSDYQTQREELFGSKSLYMNLSAENINDSYNEAVNLLNSNYEILVSILDTGYSQAIQENVDNKMYGVNSELDILLDNVFNKSNTQFPEHILGNILISRAKNELLTRKQDILSDINKYKNYLIQAALSQEIEESTEEFIDGLSSSGGILSFSYTDNGTQVNIGDISIVNEDFSNESTDSLSTKLDLSSSDAQQVLNRFIANSFVDGDKVDTREDYVIALVKNIENYSSLMSSLSGSTDLSDEIFLNSINFNTLLRTEIKESYINNSQFRTLRSIDTELIDSEEIDSHTSTYLLRNELLNYGKLLLNNQSVTESTVLPVSSKIDNENLYKKYLRGEEVNYFSGYNKSLYKSISDRETSEGIASFNFGFVPSPQQYVNDSGDIVGFEYGNTSQYYFNDYNIIDSVQLDPGYNYTVKIRSFNYPGEGIALNLIDDFGTKTPVLLRGNRITKSSGGIEASISETKNENDTIHSLYVNDVLHK